MNNKKRLTVYKHIVKREHDKFMQSLTLEQIAAADAFEKWLNDDEPKHQNEKRSNENEQS